MREILRFGPVSASVATKDLKSLAHSPNAKFATLVGKNTFGNYEGGIL